MAERVIDVRTVGESGNSKIEEEAPGSDRGGAWGAVVLDLV